MSMQAAGGAEQILEGKIKWYSAIKGYGFIEPNDGSADIMIHAEIIQTGRYLPQPGDRVTAGWRDTQNGRKANWLTRIL